MDTVAPDNNGYLYAVDFPGINLPPNFPSNVNANTNIIRYRVCFKIYLYAILPEGKVRCSPITFICVYESVIQDTTSKSGWRLMTPNDPGFVSGDNNRVTINDPNAAVLTWNLQ